jgi:hypothetical protein
VDRRTSRILMAGALVALIVIIAVLTLLGT